MMSLRKRQTAPALWTYRLCFTHGERDISTTEYTEYTEKGIGYPQISQEYSEIQMH